MSLTRIEWDDAIFYCEFMAQSEKFEMDGLKNPEKVPFEIKKRVINEYCRTKLYLEDEEDIEDTIRTRFAAGGVSIHAALGVTANWKQVLLSKLTSENLMKARCFQAIGKSALAKVLTPWREKAINLKLNVVPNFKTNTMAGGVEMWISYKDIQFGPIPTMFALGHEFGHQTDFAIRETHPQVLKTIYADWGEHDHPSWEFYADTFAIVYLSSISGNRAKLMDAIDSYLADTPDDGVHPEGRLRVNQMRKAQNAF